MNTQLTWKPEYEGSTLVIFRDCHRSHNQEVKNLDERMFDFATRHAARHNWLVTVRRKESVV